LRSTRTEAWSCEEAIERIGLFQQRGVSLSYVEDPLPRYDVRLEEVLEAVLLYIRLAEEAFDGRVEEVGLIVRNHVGRVRKDTELAVGDVVVDVKRVLVPDVQTFVSRTQNDPKIPVDKTATVVYCNLPE